MDVRTGAFDALDNSYVTAAVKIFLYVHSRERWLTIVLMFSRTHRFAAFIFVVFVLFNASLLSAFFKVPCAQPVVMARLDPIVSPGGISGHGTRVSTDI